MWGGLVFGNDGKLYFSTNLRLGGKMAPHLAVFDPATEKREILGVITHGGKPADHISRAAFDFGGNLYFAEVGNSPTKLFKYEGARGKGGMKRAIRYWG
ncbi:MAG: hypothetical protein PHV34_14325 [Verrucomicrobiae bacterium]|nr:hypothetical protein [Verrucomicrobiae bacterium]